MSAGLRSGAKIVSVAEARACARAWRAEGLEVMLAAGAFDLLQAAQVRDLEAARGRGDRLIAAVSDDASAHARLGAGRPVARVADRAQLVAALRAVDLLVVSDETSADELARECTRVPGEPEERASRALIERIRRGSGGRRG